MNPEDLKRRKETKKCPGRDLSGANLRKAYLRYANLSFESILEWVAGDLGMTSAELLRRFPAAPRRGFDEAKK